jgi:hypothetical protein
VLSELISRIPYERGGRAAARLPTTRNFGEYALFEDSRYVVNYKMLANGIAALRTG